MEWMIKNVGKTWMLIVMQEEVKVLSKQGVEKSEMSVCLCVCVKERESSRAVILFISSVPALWFL